MQYRKLAYIYRKTQEHGLIQGGTIFLILAYMQEKERELQISRRLKMLNILRLLSNITTEDRNAFYCTNKLIFGKYDRLIAVSTICWFALIAKVEFLFLIRFYHCNFNIFQSTLITFTNHINRWYILHCISNKDCISV